MSTYEFVTLQTLNFNIKPPFYLILKHIQSILKMIGSSLDELLGTESYNQFCIHYERYMKDKKKEKI